MNQIGFDKESLNRVKRFLTTKVPPKLPKSSYYKFINHYGDGSWTVKDDKVLYNGRECVAKEDVAPTLERLWSDPFYNSTPRRFWSHILAEIEGISLSKVSTFLATKHTSQVFRRPRKTEITPINTKSPKEQFNLDFIDLKKSTFANLGNRYCLTIIDHFSKYAWVFPLKSRDSDQAALRVRSLFEQGHVPRVLHGGNITGYCITDD